MSEESDKLRRRLEQATAAELPAAELPAAELLDAETASLREGWIALGQLLETAHPVTEQPLDLPHPMPRRAAARWKPAAAAILAASLLVAATLAWSWMQTKGSGGSSQMAEKESKAVLPVAKTTPVEPDIEPVPDLNDLRWDDSFDEQLAMVGEDVIRVQEDWYGLDDAFGPVQAGLEQVAEDIESDSL